MTHRFVTLANACWRPLAAYTMVAAIFVNAIVLPLLTRLPVDLSALITAGGILLPLSVIRTYEKKNNLTS